MPSGVYKRTPNMQSFGSMAGMREYVQQLRDAGESRNKIALMFGVSKQTIQRVESGDWNPGRRKRPYGAK
jgi:phage portal protein BeeE